MPFKGKSRLPYLAIAFLVIVALTALGLGIYVIAHGSFQMDVTTGPRRRSSGVAISITPQSDPLRFWGVVGFLFALAFIALFVSVRTIKDLRRRGSRKRSRKREPKSE